MDEKESGGCKCHFSNMLTADLRSFIAFITQPVGSFLILLSGVEDVWYHSLQESH